MGAAPSKGKEGPLVVTDVDLWTDDSGIVYNDGDLVDQAEGSYELEETAADLFCVIPGLMMHAVTKSIPAKFVSHDGTTTDVKDFDLNQGFHFLTMMTPIGTFLDPASPEAQAIYSFTVESRRAQLVDTSKGNVEPRARAGFLDARTVNTLLSMPGSRQCFDLNMKLTQARLARVRKVGEPVSIVLAQMLAGMLGLTARPVFLGTALANQLISHYKVKDTVADRLKTLHTSKAARQFSRRTWAISKRFLSRIATISFCRAHTLGGYLIDRGDVLDASRSAPPLARGQKHRDGIVHRCAALVGLEPNVEQEAKVFYEIAKSTCDGVVLFSRQYAAAAATNQGKVISENSNVGALMNRAGMASKSPASALALRVEWTCELKGCIWFTPFICPLPDASCTPRREGGSLESRSLVRSFEKLLRYAPLGLPVVAGIVPEAEVIRLAGMAVSQAPQLAHPAIAALVPASAQTLYLKAASATTKRAIAVVTCVTYRFELGRHGAKYMEKANLVRSEEKAVSKYGPVFGEAAEQYGRAYAALPPDSKIYKLLVKHATKGVGGLTEESSEDEIKKVLDGYNAKFLEADDEVASVTKAVEESQAGVQVTKAAAATEVPSFAAPGAPAPAAAATAVTRTLAAGAVGAARLLGMGGSAKTPLAEIIGVEKQAAELAAKLPYKNRFQEVLTAVGAGDQDAVAGIISDILGDEVVADKFGEDFSELQDLMAAVLTDIASEADAYKVFLEQAKKDKEQTDDADVKASATAFLDKPEGERVKIWVGQMVDTVGYIVQQEQGYRVAFSSAIAAAEAINRAAGLSRNSLRAQSKTIKNELNEAIETYTAMGNFEYP